MKRIFVSLLVVLVLSGCSRSTLFKDYIKLDNVSWNRGNIIEFEVPIDENVVSDYFLALRHHTYFSYDYIDVNITFYTPDGEMRSRNYHYNLKNEKAEWKGDGMGELWDINFPIRKNVKFNKSGICKVRIENIMPRMETPGIIEVGLIVKKSE